MSFWTDAIAVVMAIIIAITLMSVSISILAQFGINMTPLSVPSWNQFYAPQQLAYTRGPEALIVAIYSIIIFPVLNWFFNTLSSDEQEY